MTIGSAFLRRRSAALLAAAAALAVYAWPRIIVRLLGPASPWSSYLYQYGMGLIVFFAGIGVILRSGACRPGRGRDRFWLVILFAGFVFFAALHALWIIAALRMPYLGNCP